MLIKLNLKNSEKVVILDESVYETLKNDPHLTQIRFLTNMRLHSSGCAVFQRSIKKPKAGYAIETFYLHKYIAERFLSDQKGDGQNLVSAINGDKLDCRLENITWRSRAIASRLRKTSNPTGYTGVYKDRVHEKYRAVIAHEGKTLHLGMYKTAEEAAAAYNAKSQELYGEVGKQNKIEKD